MKDITLVTVKNNNELKGPSLFGHRGGNYEYHCSKYLQYKNKTVKALIMFIDKYLSMVKSGNVFMKKMIQIGHCQSNVDMHMNFGRKN